MKKYLKPHSETHHPHLNIQICCYTYLFYITYFNTRLIHKFMLLHHLLININLLLIRVFISIPYHNNNNNIKIAHVIINIIFRHYYYINTILIIIKTFIKFLK